MAGRHMYTVFSGTFDNTGATPEIWQFGIRWLLDFSTSDPSNLGTLPTTWEPAFENVSRDETLWTIEGNWFADGPAIQQFRADDWLNDQVMPAMEAAFIAWNPGISADVELSEVSVYAVDTDGKTFQLSEGAAIMRGTWKTPVDGITTGAMLPTETSVVVSLNTAANTKRGKGRFYLPPFATAAIGAGTGGRLSTTVAESTALAFSTFLADASYADIVSTTGVVPIVTGATAPSWTNYYRVLSVRVGNVVDSQRRRRNRLSESYSTSAL